MIAQLRGRLGSVTADGLVLEVGGVGYLLHATPSAVDLAQGSEEAVLQTHLHVRDDAMELYGFASIQERELFGELRTVSGVGPKVALAIVSAYSPAELTTALAREDSAMFQSIPGIGKKLAQRIVLELRERISAVDASTVVAVEDGDRHVVARDALVGLGFTLVEAEERLSDVDAGLPVEERIREALRAA
ncbi:MAG: Holliday junction branch migration protein RuvA [Gaiellales bacterium]